MAHVEPHMDTSHVDDAHVDTHIDKHFTPIHIDEDASPELVAQILHSHTGPANVGAKLDISSLNRLLHHSGPELDDEGAGLTAAHEGMDVSHNIASHAVAGVLGQILHHNGMVDADMDDNHGEDDVISKETLEKILHQQHHHPHHHHHHHHHMNMIDRSDDHDNIHDGDQQVVLHDGDGDMDSHDGHDGHVIESDSRELHGEDKTELPDEDNDDEYVSDEDNDEHMVRTLTYCDFVPVL